MFVLLDSTLDPYLLLTPIKISIGLHALSLHLWHSITFDFFSSNSTKFSAVIKNAVVYNILCKSLTRRFEWMPADRKMQNVTFSKFHQKTFFLSLISKDQKHERCLRNTFLTIVNLSIFVCNPFVTFMVKSGHTNHHYKSMHFSVKKQYFCIFRPTGIHETV